MALSHTVSRGREPLHSQTKNNGETRPFVSVATMVLQIEQIGETISSSRNANPQSDSTGNMAQLKKPIRPPVFEPKAHTTTLSSIGLEKQVDKAKESLPPTPTPDDVTIQLPSPHGRRTSTALESPQFPSSWKPHISWHFLLEDETDDGSYHLNLNYNTTMEDAYPVSPVREPELVIPEISPIITPISRCISPNSSIQYPAHSMSMQPQGALTPPISPIVGLGVSTLSAELFRNPSSERLQISQNNPWRRSPASTPQPTTVIKLSESDFSPIVGVSRSFEPLSSPFSTPIHSPTLCERAELPDYTSISSPGNANHVPNSPHQEQVKMPFHYDTDIYNTYPDRHQQACSRASSVYIDYESLCANMDENEWQDDSETENYTLQSSRRSSFCNSQLVDEYRALANQTYLDQLANSNAQNIQRNVDSIDEETNHICLVPHPLFWDNSAPLKRSNARRVRAVPSKCTSAVFIPRQTSGRQISSIISSKRGSKVMSHKISSPSPVDDCYVAPMHTSEASSSVRTMPRTPTLPTGSPTVSTSGTYTTANWDSPPTSASGNSSPISPFYPFSPLLPPMRAPSSRSVTSLSTTSVVKSPPTVDITESPPNMVYITNLEQKHKRDRHGVNGWHKSLTPLTSALKTVKASLTPRSASSLSRQRSVEWESEEDHEERCPCSKTKQGRRLTGDSLRQDSLPLTSDHVDELNLPQEETEGWGLKELLAEKRAERSRRKRGEEIKRTIKYVAVVDPAKVKYDLKSDGVWI